MLLHDIPEEGPVSILNTAQEDEPPVRFVPRTPSEPFPLTDAYYASAKISNVAGLRIYRDSNRGFLRGLMIEYRNGSKRVLGCSRFDAVEEATDLSYFAFASVTRTSRSGMCLRNVDVKLSKCCDETSGWRGFSEGDIVEVWFTDAQMVMDISR